MGVKERVEAAKKALGYGVHNTEYPRFFELYKSVYLCSSECGGVGCHVDVTVYVYKANGRIKVYVNGWTERELEKRLENPRYPDDVCCFACMKDYIETLMNQIYENL